MLSKLNQVQLLFVVLFCFFNACKQDMTTSNEIKSEISSNSAQFALDLFKSVSGTNEFSSSNLFLSPFSITLALATTLLGTSGTTKDQLKQALSYEHINDNNIHRRLGEISQSLASTSSDRLKLSIANRIFVEKSFSILDSFKQNTELYYHSQAEQLDFKNEANKATGVINNWVSSVTNNKIENFLSEDAITPLTAILIINAVYFKGLWKHQFQSENTAEGDFFSAPDVLSKAQFMTRKISHMYYAESEDFKSQILELPYRDSEIKAYIILPRTGTTLDSLIEHKLNASHLHNPRKSFGLSYSNVNLTLPKFKFSSSLDLKENLHKLGVEELFTYSANLTNLCSSSSDLKVSKVVHKSVVEVNEHGTEAAGVTMVEATFRMLIHNYVQFKIDRPFLFYIVDTTSETVLFLGKVLKP